ncbi:MAG: sucrase ferredoxin [Actinomycetota bacterium]|nr:sucrase ferredoxin [Actinomycetota bacterium]
MGAQLARRAARAGVRVLLIRRHVRSQRAGHRYYLAWTGTRPWLGTGRLERFEQALALDLHALAAGRRPEETEPDHLPLYAVCTHGRKDPCCAQFGRPVVAALSVALRHRVWECTHLGGDRFAATLLCLPHGLYFGRVPPSEVLRIAHGYAAGRIDLERFRGRAGLHMAAQAADWHVRRQEGLLGVEDLHVVAHTVDEDGTHAVELAGPQHRYRIRVRREASEARPVGCGDERLWTPSQWRLIELTRAG